MELALMNKGIHISKEEEYALPVMLIFNFQF
jgi:hypothetical protein